MTTYAAYATTVDGYGDYDVIVLRVDPETGGSIGEPLLTVPYVDDIDYVLREHGWTVVGAWEPADFGSVATVTRA